MASDDTAPDLSRLRGMAALPSTILLRVSPEELRYLLGAVDELAQLREAAAPSVDAEPARPVSLEFHGGAWGPATDREPDAAVNQILKPSHLGWCWWAAGKMGDAASLGEAKGAAEAAFYKARCTAMRDEARDVLHDLESATQTLRTLLERG